MDPVAAAIAHQSRIDPLWDFDDPAGSESRFRAAAQGTSGAEAGVLLTQVARAMGLAGRFDEALALLDQLPGSDPEIHVRGLLERGRVLNSSQRPDDARALFEAAFKAAGAAGFEFLAIDALHMVAIVAPADQKSALDARALELAESATDPRARKWRASLLNNAGWTDFDAGRLEQALAAFEGALDERRAQGEARETGVARWSVARTLRALGRSEEALAEQLALRADNARAGTGDSYVDEEIGECLLSLGRPDEAAQAFRAALDQAESGAPGEDADPERLARLRALAGSTPAG